MMKTESFYDLRNRKWVNIPANQVTKESHPATLFNKNSTVVNYFLCAKNADGKQLRKTVNKETFDNW